MTRALTPLRLGAALSAVLASLPAQVPAPAGASLLHPDGTYHWYEVVAVPGGINWDQARLAAHQAGGHLATIDAAAENALIHQLIQGGKVWDQGRGLGPWIGGIQATPAQEPAGGWGWAEWHAFGAVTNWATGQPDDKQSADRIAFGGAAGIVDTWVDEPASTKAPGYVIEFAWGGVHRTAGLLRDSPGRQPGYTLYGPLRGTETYLIDERGREINRWKSQYTPAVMAYLMDNGDLLRCGNLSNPRFVAYGGGGGVLERFDWSGKLVWSFTLNTTTEVMHHDVHVMPNGNILAIVWYVRSRAEALAAGRSPARLNEGLLCPCKVIEIKPDYTFGGGSIVWQWDPWDHLIQDFDASKAGYGKVGAHPERIDVNVMADNNGDWMHTNSIHYNAQLDQIVLSVRHFDELWVIDHSTTSAEAKTDKGGRSGKGGRLLYRWGNPAAYRQGTSNDRQLFRQHDVHWIDAGLRGAGKMLLFNNGPGRGYSSVDELTLPTPDAHGNYPLTNGAWGPAAPSWTYVAPNQAASFSSFVSGVQRQPNGNTLICYGALGRLLEIDAQQQIVWEFENPRSFDASASQGLAITANEVFRAVRYPADHPGLQGRTLTPRDPLTHRPVGLRIEGAGVEHFCQPGETVDLEISARLDQSGARRLFQVFCSGSVGALPFDNRLFPLAADPLFYISLANVNTPVFQNTLGRLDANGVGRAAVAVPAIVSLSGLSLQFCFVVYEQSAPSEVGLVGSRVPLHIR